MRQNSLWHTIGACVNRHIWKSNRLCSEGSCHTVHAAPIQSIRSHELAHADHLHVTQNKEIINRKRQEKCRSGMQFESYTHTRKLLVSTHTLSFSLSLSFSDTHSFSLLRLSLSIWPKTQPGDFALPSKIKICYHCFKVMKDPVSSPVTQTIFSPSSCTQHIHIHMFLILQ